MYFKYMFNASKQAVNHGLCTRHQREEVMRGRASYGWGVVSGGVSWRWLR
ncbi:MAG: hypothetical protein RI925_2152 [Pseudomonadota bacterium]|jgi:hypothetical protein